MIELAGPEKALFAKTPSNWRLTTVGRLIDDISGGTPSKDEPDYWRGTIPWVSPKDMKRPVISDSIDHISQRAVSETSLRLLEPPVVLAVVRGMILAHSFPVALTDAPVTINQDMKALKPRDGVYASFLAYVLRGLEGLVLARVEESGHGTKALRSEQWKSLPVALPPLATQRAIANFLDQKTVAVDELIAKKERLIDLLEEKRAALINRAVTRGLDPDVPMKDSGVPWIGEIPESWNVTRLGFIIDENTGSTPSKDKPEYWQGVIPWVSPKDMKVFDIDDSQDHVSREALNSLTLLPRGTVLIVVRGMILARTVPVAVTTEQVTINQDMKGLVPRNGIASRFLAYSLRGFEKALLSLVEESGHGTKALRSESWKDFQVPVPPIDQQRRVAEELDKATTHYDDAGKKLAAQLARLAEYRESLITAAVTGQIDIKNEPSVNREANNAKPSSVSTSA